MTTPQQLGREFEKFWAKKFGGKTTPASGAKWYSKLDVRSGRILWSLKFTSFKSFPVTQALLDEAFDASEGMGGEGTVPALGLRIGSSDYDVVVIRRDDFIELMKSEPTIEPTKVDERRARSRVPLLLRGDPASNK